MLPPVTVQEPRGRLHGNETMRFGMLMTQTRGLLLSFIYITASVNIYFDLSYTVSNIPYTKYEYTTPDTSLCGTSSGSPTFLHWM